MSTISIPLDSEMTKYIEDTARESGLSKADLVRQAIRLYAEEQAIQKVLRAAAEPTISGDLDTLLSQLD
jgi:Arc/MetJ-type ribon-helix-helix transcriptional regulator